MPIIDYRHRHSAHCENGVIVGMLGHRGCEVSEAMVFGLGSGIFFAYLPFLKIGSLPLTTYRTLPGRIFRRCTRLLGVKVRRRRFRDHAEAMAALDAQLATGIPTAVQAGIWWLPYFPPHMRFHFNAHNLVVYGREGDEYLVSDPVLDDPVRCHAADLEMARFSPGPMSPRGLMYHVADAPAALDLRRPLRPAIRRACREMLNIPLPFFGIRGIRLLSRRMRRWARRDGGERAALCLGTVIRMQEEIGTGGAGFRFLYAAFLQEAAALTGVDGLAECSARLTAIGDRWREFAAGAARHCKGRAAGAPTYDELADIVAECAEREHDLFRDLDRLAKRSLPR
jgi:hypothetical protein